MSEQSLVPTRADFSDNDDCEYGMLVVNVGWVSRPATQP